MITHMSTTK